jgi:hypothetical protein
MSIVLANGETHTIDNAKYRNTNPAITAESASSLSLTLMAESSAEEASEDETLAFPSVQMVVPSIRVYNSSPEEDGDAIAFPGGLSGADESEEGTESDDDENRRPQMISIVV